METFYNQRKRSRAIALEGETVLQDDTYKTCKLNLVQINGEFHPAFWNSVDGWRYFDVRQNEMRLVPDDAEISCEWDYPSRQVAALQELDSYLLKIQERLGI